MAQTSRLVIEIDTTASQRRAELFNQELGRITNAGNGAAGSVDNLGRQANSASRDIDLATKAARSLVGIIGGIAAVSKAIALADEYSQMASRIRNATESAAEYQLVQDRLLETANNTYRPLKEAQEVYLGTADTLKDLGYTTSQALDIADSLSYAFVINATESDKAKTALDNYSKSMITGKVSSDAFIAITGAADNIVADLAKQTGKTAAEIKKLGIEGKIALSDLNETLRTTKDQNLELAQAMSTSVADGFQALTNSIGAFLGKQNEAYGATGALAAGLGELAENLELVANTGAALAIGYVTKALVAGTIATKEKIVTYGVERAAALAQLQVTVQATTVEAARTAATVATIQSQIALAEAHIVTLTGLQRLAYVEGTLIPLRTALTGATVAATEAGLANTAAINAQAAAASRGAVAMGAFRALLGGPAGIIGLVAAAGTAFYLMRDSSDSATQSLSAQAETVDALAQKYRDLSLAKAISEIATLQSESEKAAKEMKSALSDAYGIVGGAFDLSVRPTEQIAAWQAIASRVGIVGDKALTTAQALAEMRRAGFDESDIAKASKAFVVYETGEKKVKNAALAIGFLREESKTATDATDELAKKIDGQRLAVKVATDEVQKQSEAMQQQIKWQQEYAESANISTVQQARLTKAVADYEKGVIAAGQLAVIFGENVKIPKEARDSFVDQATKTDLAKVAFNGADGALKALTSATDGASKAAQEHNQKLKESEKAANAAQTAYQAYQKVLLGSIQTAAIENKLLERGYSGNKGKNLADVVKAFPTKAQIETPEGQQAIKDALALSAIQDQLAAKQDAIKDSTKAVAKEESALTKARKKAAEDALRANEQRLNEYKQIVESLDDESTRVNKVYSEQKRLIEEFASSADVAKQVQQAHDAAKQKLTEIGVAQAREYNKYFEFESDKAESIEAQYEQEKLLAVNNTTFTIAEREKIFDALERQKQQELALIKLSDAQSLLYAKQGYLSQKDYMVEYYALEREQIRLTKDKSDEWRAAQEQAIEMQQFQARQAMESAAFGTFSSAFQIDDEAQRQNQYDVELAQQAELLNQQLVTYEEYLQAKAEITKRYNDAESSLRLSQAGETLGSFASMFKDIQGEQSTAYRVMFAAQKGFAIAQSVMAIQAAIASSAMSLPFPANLGAMATVAAQMASIVSTISSVTPQGFANGGYTGAGGKYDPAGIVHKGEVVWSQSDIKRAGGVGTVESMRKGGASTGGNVYVSNYSNESVKTSQDQDGNTYLTIGDVQKEIDRYVPAQLSNPNSRISRSLGQNTQTMRKR